MSETTFLLSLARECVGKSLSRSTLFDKSAKNLQWITPEPRVSPMNMMTFNLILDPYTKMREKYPDLMWTTERILIKTCNPVDVYRDYEPYEQFELPSEPQYVTEYSGGIRPKLKAEFNDTLSELVDYCGIGITVTSNFVLNAYGSKSALAYAQYQLFVASNHFYGYSLKRVELNLSKQPSVAGPERQHLLTIFQQTGVNAYMPPFLDVIPGVSVDELYLAGDKVQILSAEKISRDVVIKKTDVLEKECSISSFVRDILTQNFKADVEQIMLKFGTFIQIPTAKNIVRVVGTTRRSIDSSIGELIRLYSSVYCIELQARFDRGLAAEMGSIGINACSTSTGTIIYGPRERVHESLNALKIACNEGIKISVLIEQPLESMDFILGKKQGKILKVVNGTHTDITVEKCHEYNFRLRLSGNKVTNILEALALLEAELPAEKSLYIPEVYHKQVIGQGGLAIQQLMRKYNVYMRFANTTKDKYPNAFGDSRSHNVVIRCPAKNKIQIDSAAQELLQNVEDLAKSHHCSYVKLTRNHRRLLLATQSNGLREIEVNSGAAIKLPSSESKETQLIEISGQTHSSTETAVTMMAQLLSQTDYEFRIPWRKSHFAMTVGSDSSFNEEVAVPLFLAMSAQVQAFEKVQIVGDSNYYSQVVVSVHEQFEGEFFEDISEIVTAYLRKHNLDIVDKGKLSTELQIVSEDDLNNARNAEAGRTDAFRTKNGTELYRSPQQHASSFSLNFLKAQSQQAKLTATLPTLSTNGIQVTVPSQTPEGLPPRPPMTSVHWNRNFDETPVKRRTEHENISQVGRANSRTNIGHDRLPRYQRRF